MAFFLKQLAIQLLAALFPTEVIAKVIVQTAKNLAKKSGTTADDAVVQILEDHVNVVKGDDKDEVAK
ncbi:hypothetical protein FDJ28_gp08 [Pseudomonas phage Bjorn]|uniref:Uncharacterized protein n=1 Tax=Pseudomonas phage Bjorn TaxID=2079288 RepID=A0A2K9VHD9_9CAUD|nr:hypothetical protein FDJ28_gp08 [Pseudomonas phage Bjorn]AUV61754.1 hypothetical protein PsPhBjorn_gp62 [Pseudomonas phage Bjorn]